MIIAHDTFTGTLNDALQQHTSDSGHTWAYSLFLANQNTARITSQNRLSGTDSGNPQWLYNSSAVPDSADYNVQADAVYVDNGSGQPGIAAIVARMSLSDLTCYIAGGQQVGVSNGGLLGDKWFITKYVGGVYTVIASAVASYSVGGVYTMRLNVTGTLIQLYIDEVLTLSVTDTSISAKGRPGLYGFNSKPTHSIQLDNWEFEYTSQTILRLKRC